MTRQELEQQYLVVDGMTFTPRYEYNEETDDYTITATAEEVYTEWQAQQSATPTPPLEERNRADIDYLLMLMGE